MLQALTHFAIDYNYSYSPTTEPTATGSSGISAVLIVIYLAVVVFMLASMWRVFTKARQPGWAALVPIYNTYVLLKAVGRPGWWLLLCLVPLVNLVIAIVVANDLAKSFGKGVGFTVLLILLPFVGYPMLAWGDAQYKGPAAAA